VSSSTELRILLDSTYILPILGVEVEGIDEVLVVLRRLRRKKRARFYYTEFNILEILGKIAKVRYNRDIVATGGSGFITFNYEVHPFIFIPLHPFLGLHLVRGFQGNPRYPTF